MIQWPQRAIAAVRKLFEPLQDVDVYVEDAGDEVFYSQLLRRITDGDEPVVRVFAKGSRTNVIEAAKNHPPDGRRAVYVIDGDLEWVLNHPAPGVDRVFRLPAYCIENLLVSEGPAVRLVVEEGILSEMDASHRLGFANWVSQVERPLVELFAAFAVAREYIPTVPTVSLGVGRFFFPAAKGTPSTLDATKVALARDQVLSAAGAVAGLEKVKQVYSEVLTRSLALKFPLDSVSGKDFVLPLLNIHLQRCKCPLRRDTLRWRMALHCDRARFEELREAIRNAR